MLSPSVSDFTELCRIPMQMQPSYDRLVSCIRSSSHYSEAFQKDMEAHSCLKQGDSSA